MTWGNAVASIAAILAALSALFAWQQARSAKAAAKATQAALELQRARYEKDFPAVRWKPCRAGKHTYRLTNTGTETAKGVLVRVDTRAPVSGIATKEPTDVPDGQSVEFSVIPVWGAPVPPTVQVTWEGHPEPQHVPIPP